MKRETIVTIILGILLGVTFALILVLSTKQKAIKNKKIIISKLTPTTKITIQKMVSFTITEPTPGYITNKDVISLKGKAEKNSLIVIQSAIDEKVIKTTDNHFSSEFPLSLGENLIQITNYQKNNIEEKALKVYYLKE